MKVNFGLFQSFLLHFSTLVGFIWILGFFEAQEVICAQGRGASTLGQKVWGKESKSVRLCQCQVAPGAGASHCICQVEEEERRKFGHCLLTRVRRIMLEGWVSRSLEN